MDLKQEIREKMPEVAAFVDEISAVFGEESGWLQVERSLAGEPTFWAREGGRRIGTRNTVHTSAIRWDQFGIAYSSTPDWIIEAREFARRRGIDIRPAKPDDLNDIKREANELRAMIEQAKNKGRGK